MAIMPTAPAKPPATSSVANDMAVEVTGQRVAKILTETTLMEDDRLLLLGSELPNLLNDSICQFLLKEGTSTHLPPTCRFGDQLHISSMIISK